jgi:hypothetical protein
MATSECVVVPSTIVGLQKRKKYEAVSRFTLVKHKCNIQRILADIYVKHRRNVNG